MVLGIHWHDAHDRLKQGYLTTTQMYDRHVRPTKRRFWSLFVAEVNSWSTWVDMPLSERLTNYRNGFLSKSAALYDFDTYDRKDYLTDLERQRTAYINEHQFSGYLTNKLGFHWAMQGLDDHRCEVYGVIDGGRFHPLADITKEGRRESPDTSVDAAEYVFNHVESGDDLIVKPCDKSGGKGVRRYGFNGEKYHINGTDTTADKLSAEVAGLDATLVMEHVEQADYAANLFPDSANTIRVITMWDSHEQEVFCPIAVHRIGTEATVPIDNFGAGGISAKVDLETGELSEGVQFTDAGITHTSTHPDTGSQIEGTTIPGWEDIRDGVLNIADEFSHVPYVGWDVVVTDPGEFVIIEANGTTDVDLLQAHGPLLTNDQTRRFYEFHGIL